MLKDSVRDHNEGPRLMTLGSDSSGSYNKKRTFWRLKMGKAASMFKPLYRQGQAHPWRTPPRIRPGEEVRLRPR
jgi:hypothetical protein